MSNTDAWERYKHIHELVAKGGVFFGYRYRNPPVLIVLVILSCGWWLFIILYSNQDAWMQQSFLRFLLTCINTFAGVVVRTFWDLVSVKFCRFVTVLVITLKRIPFDEATAIDWARVQHRAPRSWAGSTYIRHVALLLTKCKVHELAFNY